MLCHIVLLSLFWGSSYCCSCYYFCCCCCSYFASVCKDIHPARFGKLNSSFIGKGGNAFVRDETTGDWLLIRLEGRRKCPWQTLSFCFSLSLSFSFWQNGKEKKMPSSRNCCTPLFLIFHMRGFYLSTGGSRKAGFLLSRCINTFSPTTCSLINCNYFRSQDNPGFWKQIHQMLFKVKTQARYRTNEREVFTACVTFPCKCLQTTETDIKE